MARCGCGRPLIDIVTTPRYLAAAVPGRRRLFGHSTSSSSDASLQPSTSGRAATTGPLRAVKADKELAWVSPENRKELLRLLELADRAADRWEVR